MPEIDARTFARSLRWIAHLDNRLTYERAMLEDQGATALLAPKPKSAAAQLPLCNYRAPGGLQIENVYHRGELIHYPQVDMTQAEYSAIHTDYKATRVVGHSHRVRTTMQRHSLVCVFLTDAKVHVPPAPKEAPLRRSTLPERDYPADPKPEPFHTRGAEGFEAMKESLKAGVQVVSAPQLFPTPAELARRMRDLADIHPGLRVLEPSAGTGVLIENMATQGGNIVAVEINQRLADALRAKWPHIDVRTADFLSCNGDLGQFDRIVMNPPFERGSDVRHILHALSMLKPGGRLVAICADGSKQRAVLQPIADSYESLPPGTFASQGTGVNTALVVLHP